MPHEAPADAAPVDPVARFEQARHEFAQELRDLHIDCGKPKQQALIAAADEYARKQDNAVFRLNATTLSEVLNGRRVPSHDFLDALLRQLDHIRPGAKDRYLELWKMWRQLKRQQSEAARYLRERKAAAARSAEAERQREQAEDLLSAARRQADNLVTQAHADAESMLWDARDRSSDITGAADDDAAIVRRQADAVMMQVHADALEVLLDARDRGADIVAAAEEVAAAVQVRAQQLAVETRKEAEQHLRVQSAAAARRRLYEEQHVAGLRRKAEAVLQQALEQAESIRAQAVRESAQARERFDEERRQARSHAEAEAARVLEKARKALERAERRDAAAREELTRIRKEAHAVPAVPVGDWAAELLRGTELLELDRELAEILGKPLFGKQLVVRPRYDLEAWTPGDSPVQASAQTVKPTGHELDSADVTRLDASSGTRTARDSATGRLARAGARRLPTEGFLDQVVFRCEDVSGRAGMAAVAYSCTPQNADQVLRRLDPLLGPTPRTGQGYSLVRCVLPDSNDVAVLSRIPTVDRMGRPSVFVHALVGSGQVLTAPTSVMLQPGLPDWPGVSEDAAGGLPRLSVRDLQQRFSEEEPHYRAAIEHVRPLLEAAVAQLIKTPENRLSFHAQEQRAHAPVLIWALSTLLEPWLGDDAFTYVSGDGDEHLRLKLIFVPAWKVLMGERSLSRVFSKRSPDQARSIAEDLVDRFILDEGNPARAHNVLARCPNPRSRTLSERLDILTRAL